MTHKILRYCCLLFLGIIIITSGLIYGYYQKEKLIVAEQIPKLAFHHGTNTNAAFYTLQDFKTKLTTLYPATKDSVFKAHQTDKNMGTYVVPGLKEAQTLSLITKRPAICHEMTPQGIAVTPDYLIISAYCHEKKHNSVLYLINRNNHQLVKTIVLKGKPHAGGVTYDPVFKTIWVCGRHYQQAELFSIKLSTLQKYHFDFVKRPIKYSQRVFLPTIKKASMVAYHHNQLLVGFFDKFKRGILQSYDIYQTGKYKGQIVNGEIDARTKQIDTSPTFIQSTTILGKIQGVAIYHKHIYLARSYGPNIPSKIFVFKYDNRLHQYDAKNAIKIMTLPPHLEQITIKGNNIYAIFESAAFSYCTNESINMDRIIMIKLEV